jgi:hypothetical protein
MQLCRPVIASYYGDSSPRPRRKIPGT